MSSPQASSVLPEERSGTAGLTVGDYLEQWLLHMRGRIRGSTYDGYAGLVHNHAVRRLGSRALAELRPLDVQRCYQDMLADPRACAKGPVSAKTVGNLHRVLRTALGQAVRWQLVPTNAAAAAEPPRYRPAELAVVDTASATRILGATAGTRLEAPVALALATGMRRGEILGLRWADLDTALTVARVVRSLEVTSEGGVALAPPKTARSRRAVALPQFLRPYLLSQRERQRGRRAEAGDSWAEHDLVVDAGRGGPWNPDTFSRAWGAFCTRRGLPRVRFHDLRHAHATFMLLQGVHPKVVSERLGHASVGITLDTYSHVLPTMQAEAVRAFDALFPAAGG